MTSRTTESSLLSRSAEGATLLIGLQFGSRALTFAVNQFLLRYLSPERLGIASQLEVYSISVLFFARESLRVAIQRQTDIDEKPATEHKGSKVPNAHIEAHTPAGKTQAVVNLAYVSIGLGFFFALFLAWLYLGSLSAGDPLIFQTPYFVDTLGIYGVAAFSELLAEPCFAVVQQKSRYRVRATAEIIATLARCSVTCLSAVWAMRMRRDVGLLPLALGQSAYGLFLPLVYYYSIWSVSRTDGFALVPKKISSHGDNAFVLSYLSRPLVSLGISMFTQSLVKHVLSQGDTLLIASLASQAAQGVYAMANNYGGLVARLVFQPIEESSRNYFSKLLSPVEGNISKQRIAEAKESLQTLLHFYILLSTTVLCIGPTVAPLLLSILAGSRWIHSGAGRVLANYCYYIPFLAINGVTEAFVSSVATKEEVNRQSMWMLAFSAGFGGSAFVLLRILHLGADGLIWANTLNMVLRIMWSVRFISSFLQCHETSLDLRSLLPHKLGIAVSVATYALLARTEMKQENDGVLYIIFRLGCIILAYMMFLTLSERSFLLQVYRSVLKNTKT